METPSSSLEFSQGTTRILRFTVSTESGEPVNLSEIGVKLKWSLFPLELSTPMVTKAIGSGITIDNGPLGKCSIKLEPQDSDDLVGVYDHELFYSDNDGHRSLIHKGTISFSKAKTKIGE